MKPASKAPKRPADRVPAHAGLKRLGIALALSATTFGAHAAGLGRLQLMSNLGQPLRAEIELTAIGRDEAGSVTARLAPPAAFTQAGIEYGTSLTSLRFSVQRRASGQAYVLVTSVAQLNEPFLDMLVELTWSSGRLVREYTVLLDPPETRTAAAQGDPAAGIVQAATPAGPTAIRRAPRVAAAAGTDAAAGVASARRGADPTASTSATTGSSSGDYVVKNGDTALSIARTNKPDNVSLEQMLAALYRDNQQAFGGNINRLMAGATLRLPDAANAQGIDGGEARRIVAQSSNFGRYGQRIAAGAGDATRRSAGQQASGRLSTQVQDQSTAAESADRLQLSRPDGSRSATGAVGKRTGAGASSADEAAAKDRELTEARTRLALLEKNVTDLQELLKLKNQTLADLQKGGAKPGDAAPAPAVPSGAPATPAVATPSATATAPTPPAVTAAAVVASAPAPSAAPASTVLTSSTTPPAPPAPTDVATPAPVAPTVAPAPAKSAPAAPLAPLVEEHWYDAILENTMLMVGLVVLLLALLAAAVFAARRRRLAGFEDSIFVDNSVLHANSVFGTTGGQSVDTANSGFHSNFVPVAGNLPEHNEVDPVAEADVYIAYGRDAQAEEILKEALRADPARHAVRLKLLEIYAKRGDAKTFETMASELYASTGGQGDEWRQAATLGATLDPRNPLYADAVPVDEPAAVSHASSLAAPAALVAAAATTRADATATHLGTDFGAGTSQSFGMSSLNFNTSTDVGGSTIAKAGDLTRTDPMPRTPPTAPTSAPDMDLDFDLGGQGAPVAPLHAATEVMPSANGLDPNGTEFSRPGDPFTASAFGTDATARTAVNLPAFRARNGQQPPEPAGPTPTNGFSASDIFGSTIVADTQPMMDDTPPLATPVREGSLLHASDFQTDDGHQFDKTEPLDAFSKINLDLDQTEFMGENRTDLGVKTDVWQAMATKLDLALAYSDIGDKDGARELLEEVVRSGDPTQAERARQLITELG